MAKPNRIVVAVAARVVIAVGKWLKSQAKKQGNKPYRSIHHR